MTHTEESKLLESIASKDAEIARLREALSMIASDGTNLEGRAWIFAAGGPHEALYARMKYAKEALATPATPTADAVLEMLREGWDRETTKASPPTPPEGYEIYEPDIVEEWSLVCDHYGERIWTRTGLVGMVPSKTHYYARPIKSTPTPQRTGVCDKCGEILPLSKLTIGNPLSLCHTCMPQAEPGEDTPRTDAEMRRIEANERQYEDRHDCYVALLVFARQLERELAEAKARLDRIAKGVEADQADLDKMRDGTKLSRSGVVELVVYLKEDLAEATDQLAAVRREVEEARTVIVSSGLMEDEGSFLSVAKSLSDCAIKLRQERNQKEDEMTQRDAHVRQELDAASSELTDALFHGFLKPVQAAKSRITALLA